MRADIPRNQALYVYLATIYSSLLRYELYVPARLARAHAIIEPCLRFIYISLFRYARVRTYRSAGCVRHNLIVVSDAY